MKKLAARVTSGNRFATKRKKQTTTPHKNATNRGSGLSWRGPPNLRFGSKTATEYLADDYPEAAEVMETLA
jgi:hypothetical protein